jgi:thiol-disulfide isomerase/thioredoxin
VSSRRLTAAGVLAGAVLLVAAGALGFWVQRMEQPPSSLRVAPTRSVPGARAASPTAASAPRRIPERLPDFVLPGLDGAPHRLSDWKGRPLVVNFWATWCEPCRREIPLLKEIHQKYAKDGVEIVGIAVDYREPVEKFARRLGIGYPVLIGDKGGLAAVTAFGMDTVLPFSVFADRDGRIVTLKIGELHRDEADFILARLVELDQGHASLTTVREEIADGMHRFALTRAASGGSSPE